MSKGQRAKLICSSEFAYGSAGVQGVYPFHKTLYGCTIRVLRSVPLLPYLLCPCTMADISDNCAIGKSCKLMPKKVAKNFE